MRLGLRGKLGHLWGVYGSVHGSVHGWRVPKLCIHYTAAAQKRSLTGAPFVNLSLKS